MTAQRARADAVLRRARLAPADAPGASPIPARVGDSSPIKYVFYVIRENRTYDQVLGDLPKGNGDPSLTLFGEDVTPNAHALSTTFTTFDNFYVDAEVSYDGPRVLHRRLRTGLSSRRCGRQLRPPRGAVSERRGLQDAQPLRQHRRAGAGLHLGLREAGQRLVPAATASSRRWEPPGGTDGRVGALARRPHPSDLSRRSTWRFPDVKRIEIFAEEFKQFVASGTVPRLSIIRPCRGITRAARVPGR
jgi:hypothetical protein